MVIAGPTAVGKTALSIQLAKHYNTVILSADSRQFYRELNIGTAKPSPDQLSEVKHHFINNKSIDELYGAGHYEKDAIALLKELFREHKIVFMVGGSGLYIDAVLYGVDEFDEVPAEVRQALNRRLEEKGLEVLLEQLKELDADYYNLVDKDNSQRVIRALEVCIHTGKPFSSFLGKGKQQRDFTAIKILVNTDRQQLYKKINDRVDEMMKQGLLDEVKSVIQYRDRNALKTVGYKELLDYLDEKTDLETAVDRIKQHTRNYAKRQITWFKNQDEFEEFEPTDFDKIKAYIDIIKEHA